MKYTETGFRAIYHNFVVVEADEQLKKLIEDFPGAADANAVLAYGYYDREAGLSLEVLAAAIIGEKGFQFARGKQDVTAKIRVGSIADREFRVCSDTDGSIAAGFAGKLETLKIYEASEEIGHTREMAFLDALRDETYIDDVRVKLLKEGMQPEECWVRLTGHGVFFLKGTLLNEPYQQLGIHEGDALEFFAEKTADEEIICYADLDQVKIYGEEELEDGSILKAAVKAYQENAAKPRLLNVLRILRSSYVWIPCTAVMSEADNERFEAVMREHEEKGESAKGTEFRAEDPIRMIPSLLKNGEKVYFPVFSNEGEMGEGARQFSKLQKPFVEALPLAREKDKDISAIILDPFTDPFLIDPELFDDIEKL